MPRDAADTRERLVASGQRLFAAHGVYSTPLARIVADAGQKNASALQYHFAGRGFDAREGLLFAIIEVHNDSIEDARRVRLDGLGDHPDLRELVRAVVEPMAVNLTTPEGREFLSIISQLVDWFDRWDEGNSPEQALRAFRLIEASLPPNLTPAVRRERISRFLEMVSEALGSRARRIATGQSSSMNLDDDEYVANVVDMAVGALSATGR